MDKEEDVVDLEFAVTEPVSIVGSVCQIEFGGLWSFQHQYLMGHFVTHFPHVQSIVVRNELVLLTCILLFHESSPHFFGDQPFFVNGIEKDENTTTGTLDVSEDLNCVNNPWIDVQSPVVELSSGKTQVQEID